MSSPLPLRRQGVWDVEQGLRDTPQALHGAQGGCEKLKDSVRQRLGFLGGPAVKATSALVGPGSNKSNELVVGQLEGGSWCRLGKFTVVLRSEGSPGGHGFVTATTGGPVSPKDGFPGVDHELEHGLGIGKGVDVFIVVPGEMG